MTGMKQKILRNRRHGEQAEIWENTSNIVWWRQYQLRYDPRSPPRRRHSCFSYNMRNEEFARVWIYIRDLEAAGF